MCVGKLSRLKPTAVTLLLLVSLLVLISCGPKTTNSIIGVALVPQTGSGAVQGKYMGNGIDMYRRDHPDSEISLSILDSRSDPNTAISALNQSIALKRPQFVMSALSYVSGAVIPQTQEKGLFTILVVSSADSIMKGQTVVQRINPRAEDYVAPLVSYSRGHFKKVAVIYSDEEYGASNLAAFKASFESSDRNLTTAESYKLGDTKPIRTIVQKVLATKPEAVFVTGYGPAYFAVFTALKDYGYKGQVMGCPNIGQPEALAAVKDAADGVVFSGTDMELSKSEREQTRAFAEKYRAAYNSQPFYVASYVYDALAIVESLSKNHQALSPESFTKLGSWDGVTGKLQFLSGGECHASMIAIRHESGQNVRVQ